MGNPASGIRIVVLGYMVRGPLGGLAWHHLQYLMGLLRLGHDAYFIEDSDDYPSCYDPQRHTVDTDARYGLRFASQTFAKVGAADRWAYYDAHTRQWHGPLSQGVMEVCRSAELVLNVSGVNPLRPWLGSVPVRAYIDTDPVFTQIRHLQDTSSHARARQHTHFFSFGCNIGNPGCSVPNDGLPWRATRQPIVLDAWPVTERHPQSPYTTVMQWDSYPAREFEGRRYGMKSESFEPYLDLPARVGPILELALGGASAPRQLLRTKGWVERSSLEPTVDPWAYQRYIQQSKAEFAVAKHGYVVSRSGWFSERSAAYLASGRPVIVQDTGFSDWLQAPGGVVAFRSPAQAVAGIEEVNRRYAFHCKAARNVAETYFDAGEILYQLITGCLDSTQTRNNGGAESV